MKSKSHDLAPKARKLLVELGENLRLARLRRKFSARVVAERAGIGQSTLLRVEKGIPSVTMGVYLQVMFVLGLEGEFAQLGKDDVLGRKLQDAQITTKSRAPKRRQTKAEDEQ
ncbi:MAG TPA: helix-turn-helix transcriptional regulator [Bacteroidia bacterium]|nr:helix-turn-helix transcriptional regulator [Bacteroidia bacterium]